MAQRIGWHPNPGAQSLALSIHPNQVQEILYGGARGGGKTDAGIAWLTRDLHNPKFRGLVIRRNADDLKDWIDRATKKFAAAGGIPTGQPAEFKFPSGAIIRTGHLKDEEAYTKYQGHEYQRLLIEELTQIPLEKSYSDLISCCRSTVPNLLPQIFCTTNPGGPGHDWVKKRFKTGREWQSYWNKKWVGEKSTVNGEVVKRFRIFIPARVEDNPKIMELDPGYVTYLDNLPEEQRKAWREGSWDDPEIEGAVYKNEMARVRMQGRIKTLPYTGGRVYVWMDLGYGDHTTLGIMERVGGGWNVIDYYENHHQGLAHYAAILDAKSKTYGYNYDRLFGPHDMEVHDLGTGLTRRETMERLGYPVTVLPKAPLKDGIEALRIRFNQLVFDEDHCIDLIRALDNYKYDYDDKNLTYRKDPVHDWASHASDMMRYWAMTPEMNFTAPDTSRLSQARENKRNTE